METFSTIVSPVFSELVIVLAGNTTTHLPQRVTLFETLHIMNEVRPFKLVFSLEGSDCCQGEARRELAEALDLVTARGLLDFLDSPPIIR